MGAIADAVLLRVLGDELRRARKQRGWTRKDLKAKLATDVSLQTIATYELGTRRCNVARLLELAEALGLSVLDLLERTLDRVDGDANSRRLSVDLAAAASLAPAELAPLRRWARCRLRTIPKGQRTVVQLDPPAVEHLARLCGVEPVVLIHRLRHAAAI